MGRNYLPSLEECRVFERPSSCQTTGKHSQNQRQGVQSPRPSLRPSIGQNLFGHAQRVQGELSTGFFLLQDVNPIFQPIIVQEETT